MKSKINLSIALLVFVGSQMTFAGSATWNLNPTSGDWNTAANWTPATVPNGSLDTATFGISNTLAISLSGNTEVNGIVFSPGASMFNLSPNPGVTLTISGVGITNNSGATQNFVATVDANFNHTIILFSNSATAGSSLNTFTSKAAVGAFTYGGETIFDDNSTAGTATFITEGGAVSSSSVVGGVLVFQANASGDHGTFITGGGTTLQANGGEVAIIGGATAGSGTFINNPATALRAQGGFVEIQANSTGGDATFINNGSSVVGAGGGVTAFYSGAYAGNCTLIANGGTNGGRGGEIWFYKDSFGGTPRVQVFDNGFLDTTNSNVAIGSIEGNGVVFLGQFPLLVGTNDLDAAFSGTIRDFNSFIGGGPLRKTGSGTWVLTGVNTYTGSTTVEGGTLEVSNPRGSGTGAGPVRVRGGLLAGRGTLAGAVTVGTASGSQAVLAPGRNAINPRTLTIQGDLTFAAKGAYRCDLNSNSVAADQVVAKGVTIDSNALFFLQDSGAGTLTGGTSFIVIDNTAATPISGIFSDLADGSTVVVGNNTFQANYEGGDGNDLTLTVQ